MSRHDGKVWVRKLRTGYSSHPWEVRARNHNGYDYYETFFSWADAMGAADRLARTREVVLPRPSSIQLATIAPAKEGDKPAFVFPHTPKGVAVVANGPFFIPYDQCGLIGRALLTLEEQEGHRA